MGDNYILRLVEKRPAVHADESPIFLKNLTASAIRAFTFFQKHRPFILSIWVILKPTFTLFTPFIIRMQTTQQGR